jgi:hypothetical protein
VIEVLDLLAKNLILHQSPGHGGDPQRILIRADRLALVRGHWLLIVSGDGREILVFPGGAFGFVGFHGFIWTSIYLQGGIATGSGRSGVCQTSFVGQLDNSLNQTRSSWLLEQSGTTIDYQTRALNLLNGSHVNCGFR